MGVDASIFAKKAKKYYYFDREYNVVVFDLCWGNNQEHKYEQAIYLLIKAKSCDYNSAVYVLNKNIEFWKTQPESDHHRAGWNDQVLKFIQMFPEDEFFIATDHEDPSYWDIAKKDGYVEHLFPEDIPKPPSCHCPNAWCPLHITDKEREEQRKSCEDLIKALSVGGSLNTTKNGYLEIASLDTTLKKIKI